MPHDIRNTIATLRRTPAVLDALLRDLPDEWTRTNEGQNTWSAYDVVGHLIHGERTGWIPRAKMILEFASVRLKSLDDLRALNLQADDFERRGRHPVFGPVTLGQLLATWAAHDLTHLHQLSRLMAHQYREAVGPWSVFLGVLHCHGHSSDA